MLLLGHKRTMNELLIPWQLNESSNDRQTSDAMEFTGGAGNYRRVQVDGGLILDYTWSVSFQFKHEYAIKGGSCVRGYRIGP